MATQASQPPRNKVDVHHHWAPVEYAKAVEQAGGDPSGWAMPSWSLDLAESLMSRVGIATVMLPVTAPGACVLEGSASFKLARSLNDQTAVIRDAQPQKFGSFANLPSVFDTQASLDEIAYAYDELRADGVCIFIRYGTGHAYLGHQDIEPI